MKCKCSETTYSGEPCPKPGFPAYYPDPITPAGYALCPSHLRAYRLHGFGIIHLDPAAFEGVITATLED